MKSLHRTRVGIIGAGPVTQSIHIPALTRMSDEFEIVHIADVDLEVARAVAARVGARASSIVEELLSDRDVDVVAICTPGFLHAEHVTAACRAGVKAILCEKPFATSGIEAQIIAEVVTETNTPIIVGAMHTFDPAWVEAKARWGTLRDDVHTIRSTIIMPGGTRFEDFATEVLKRRPMPKLNDEIAEERAQALEGLIYGLTIHDLPLVRHFAPTIDRLVDVQYFGSGWLIVFESQGRLVHLTCAFTGGWRPEWHFEAISDTDSIDVEFNPSFVWAGSGRAVIASVDGSIEPARADYNGYEGEWRALAELARGNREAAPPVEQIIDDLRYAVEIAERSSDFILRGALV